MPARKKPWYRPRNLILLAVLLVGALIGREVYLSLTARPGDAVNYMDEARALVSSYQPPEGKDEPNGWPLLLDAIDRLVEAEGLATSQEALAGVPLDLTAVYAQPDRPKYDDDHTWEQVRARAMEAVANARQTGTFDLLAELAKSHRFERTLPVSGQMIGVLLPELGKMRQLARMNGARLSLARASGDDAEFVAAYEQTLALGKAAAHQAFLIDYLVGVAITALATSHLREHLADRPFSEPTLRALLEATERQQLPPIELALKGERLSTLDTIQWTHTDDGRGNGRFIPSNLTTLGALSGSGTPSSGLFGKLAEWKLLNLAALAFPSKAATTAKVNEFYDGVIQYGALPTGERRALAFQPDAFVESLPRRYLLLRILMPAIGKSVSSRDQSEMERGAVRVMLAIELYNARNGRYPGSLDALVPSILPTLPIDAISGKSFGYRLLKPEEETHPRPDGSPRPYLLYSFGVDGVDNNGAAGEREQSTPFRTPSGQDFILNTPHPTPKNTSGGGSGQ